MGTLLRNLGHKLSMESRRMRNLWAYDPRARRTRLRGPTSVQIQTVDKCNASCLMCPYSLTENGGPAHSMDDGLYNRILGQIRQTGTVRSLMLMLQNEPLLDRDFVSRVRTARQTLGPDVRVLTVTNGALLTPSKCDALASSGINGVSVSIDAEQEQTFRKIRKGLNFQRVVDNTISLAEKMDPGRVRVKFLRQRENEGEEKAFALFWRRYGIRSTFTEPCNRGGSLDGYESIRKRRPDPLQRLVYPILNRLVPACPLPFSSVCVLADGRVITCCNDWEPRDSLGDLSRQSLGEIWNGQKFNHYRHLLWSHQTEKSHVCAGCSLAVRFWRT